MKTHLIAFCIVILMGSAMGWGVYVYMNRISDPGLGSFSTVEDLNKKGVPELSLVDISGRSISTQQLAGKVVILNFWASWCEPCIEEVPSLIKLVDHFNGKVVLLAISGDSELEDITVFLKAFPGMKNENIYVVFDDDKSEIQTFGIRRLPETIILDGKNKAIRKISGTIDWYTPEAIEYMSGLINAQ
jgi:thiol-disulfide isomerase/thioredoxin